MKTYSRCQIDVAICGLRPGRLYVYRTYYCARLGSEKVLTMDIIEDVDERQVLLAAPSRQTEPLSPLRRQGYLTEQFQTPCPSGAGVGVHQACPFSNGSHILVERLHESELMPFKYSLPGSFYVAFSRHSHARAPQKKKRRRSKAGRGSITQGSYLSIYDDSRHFFRHGQSCLDVLAASVVVVISHGPLRYRCLF